MHILNVQICISLLVKWGAKKDQMCFEYTSHQAAICSFALYIRLSIDLDVFFCISVVQTDKQKLKSDWIYWLKQNQIKQVYR